MASPFELQQSLSVTPDNTNAASKPKRFGGALGQLIDNFDSMAPGTAQLAVAHLRAERPLFRGIPLLPGEIANAELEGQVKQNALLKSLQASNINKTVGFLVQNAQTDAGELAGAGKSGQTLEQHLNTRLDSSLLENPDQLELASVGLAGLMNRPEFAISKQSMFIAELPSVIDQGNRAANLVRREETARTLLEQRSETAEGGGAGGAIVEATTESLSGSSGENLGQGPGSDIDEDRGSRALLGAFNLAIKAGADAGLDPEQVVDSFLGIHGKNIADQLEGLNSNEAGELIVGQGDIGVTDLATGNLAKILTESSRLTRRQPVQIMNQIGLNDYRGIDENSLRTFEQTALASQATDSGR